MKQLLIALLMLLFIPVICFAEAGDHDRAERLKELYNKVYPKIKTINNGAVTLRRYKKSTTYYNTLKYPIGPPKHVQGIGDYKLYRREIRILRQQNKCRNRNYYK